MERKHIITEGQPGKNSLDAKEIKGNYRNDISKVLEIILGTEYDNMSQTLNYKEKSLIDRATEFRKEFEEMKAK